MATTKQNSKRSFVEMESKLQIVTDLYDSNSSPPKFNPRRDVDSKFEDQITDSVLLYKSTMVAGIDDTSICTSTSTALVVPKSTAKTKTKKKTLFGTIKEIDEYFLKASAPGRDVILVLDVSKGGESVYQNFGESMRKSSAKSSKVFSALSWSWSSRSLECSKDILKCYEPGEPYKPGAHGIALEKISAKEEKLYKETKLGYTKKPEERHFRGVITLEECNVEEIEKEEPPVKSSKDKKAANGPESGKGQSLVFKITSKVAYKTILKAHSAVVLKAESMADKVEWLSKIRNVTQPNSGGQGKGVAESGLPMRQSLSDGSLVSDVVSVACRAAADAGIRFVCVPNFSWDFIYAEYVIDTGRNHRSIVWQIAEDYSHCEFLIRLPGYCPMPALRDIIDVPLVVRTLRRSRKEVRQELGIAEDVKLVIFNFGGQPAGWKSKQEYLGRLDVWEVLQTIEEA